MTKVIINQKLLSLHADTSKGMLTSLKSISNRGVTLALYPESTFSDPILKRLFEIEGIGFAHDNAEADQVFFLTDRKNKKINGNQILIGSKRRHKNIEDAVEFISTKLRTAKHSRKTNETSVDVSLNLDGKGNYNIKTGIGFFDHMLEQISKHSNIDMKIKVKGDLNVDEHHTVEDTGITLGEALSISLKDKKGIQRFGFMLPMDDSAAQTAIDLSGRPYLNFNAKFNREKVGEFPTELVEEFFRGITIGLNANIYIRVSGKNDHHKIESIFKSFAKTLNEAVRIDPRNDNKLPTTKGKL